MSMAKVSTRKELKYIRLIVEALRIDSGCRMCGWNDFQKRVENLFVTVRLASVMLMAVAILEQN